MSTSQKAAIVGLATSPPQTKKGFLGLSSSGISRSALDSALGPVRTNVADTYSRFRLVNDARSGTGKLSGLHLSYTDKYNGYLYDKRAGDDVKTAISILASGGYPTTHMSLEEVLK